VVDFRKVEVTRNGASIELTAHEFKTLQFFVQNPDRVITRTELLKHVCGYDDGDATTRSTDNHIVKLRNKLERDPSGERTLGLFRVRPARSRRSIKDEVRVDFEVAGR
jgi:DNA-binding response OmpR family regulator